MKKTFLRVNQTLFGYSKKDTRFERSGRILNFQVRSFFANDDGEVPNNPDLPVIVYEGVFNDGTLDTMEASFNDHGWTNSWSGDVYDYHHYHANTHEVLGVKSGSAKVLIGGDAGERFDLKVGDVIVLPAGVAHIKLESTSDFQVIGAYPEGRSPDILKKDPGFRAQAFDQIKSVPLPKQDPVFGENGPLIEKWNSF